MKVFVLTLEYKDHASLQDSLMELASIVSDIDPVCGGFVTDVNLTDGTRLQCVIEEAEHPTLWSYIDNYCDDN